MKFALSPLKQNFYTITKIKSLCGLQERSLQKGQGTSVTGFTRKRLGRKGQEQARRKARKKLGWNCKEKAWLEM
jgi:hypothetical protein